MKSEVIRRRVLVKRRSEGRMDLLLESISGGYDVMDVGAVGAVSRVPWGNDGGRSSTAGSLDDRKRTEGTNGRNVL